MKIPQLLTVIFLLFMANITFSQQELIHYYVQLDGSKPQKYNLEFGKVVYQENGKIKKVRSEDITTFEQLTTIVAEHTKEENTKDEINVIIHGIWGDNKREWKKMTKNLSEQVYSIDDDKNKVLISIIWDSSLNYLQGIKIARKKGDYLASFMEELVKKNRGTKLNFLCHSMGNIIMEHMTVGSGILMMDQPVINHYICAGADIKNDIFEEGQTLENMPKITDKISIYVHNNDRSLKVSKLLNKKERLGLDGLPDINKSPENFHTIDVSTINDNHDFASSMSNHRYFYMSPTIMQDISRLIWDEDFETNKKVLDHPRRLKLLPLEL